MSRTPVELITAIEARVLSERRQTNKTHLNTRILEACKKGETCIELHPNEIEWRTKNELIRCGFYVSDVKAGPLKRRKCLKVSWEA